MVEVGVVVVKGFTGGNVAEAGPSGDPGEGVAVRGAPWNIRGAAIPEGSLVKDLQHRGLVEDGSKLSSFFAILKQGALEMILKHHTI